ncbi:MAG: glycosyltransferase, partial [Solirubrobacterales bacterium]|nr:glycosyltransferase [Solirubrobacterales bacterium]
SAEGWCLTVMEAADRGTPSAALRVGGLPESILDGQTGLLADTPEELATEVAALTADPGRRRALGEAARSRARGFTWDHTARANLDVLETAVATGRRPLKAALSGSDTGKAAGLAGASLLNNAIQLVFTVAITRLLGKADYSALAALVSAFLVLLVGGQAVQAAAAREVALGRLGDHHALLGTMSRWTRTLLVATGVAAVVGVILREPLAALMGVEEHAWAAAAVLPTGTLWMLLSLQRGALQGLQAFAPVGLSIVGEAVGRLAIGLVLALAAGGVTGVFLATPLCFLATSAGLGVVLARRLGAAPVLATPPGARTAQTLRGLMANGWVPIISLALLALLQNVDVIVARHELGEDRAGSYAVAAVAAKVVVWVAIGVGLQLLPQATARAAAGEDPRPVLLRALGVLAAVAAPSLLLFALFPTFILRTAFGPDTVDAAPALLLLGLAMTLLAVAYLTVQYMLALGSVRFLWVLGAVAAIEVPLLFSGDSITGFATLVLGAQVVVAAAVLAIGLRARPRGHVRAIA